MISRSLRIANRSWGFVVVVVVTVGEYMWVYVFGLAIFFFGLYLAIGVRSELITCR